jgi:hypothetical protein
LVASNFFLVKNVVAAPIHRFSRFARKFRVLQIFDNEAQSIFNYYARLRQSSFSAFFIENRVNAPTCFMQSRSLKRRHLELNLFKFTNFLMRNGQREQVFRYLLKAFMHVLAVKKRTFALNPGISRN